ncbi:AAA family ATPase [Bradyrhizobium sp. 162]|nr:AAA family ATPase [Bradyrhizobium sp. 162]MCK1632650.1 AAA family ATPase [Bradyrhizobium sp. 162]
MPGGTPEFEAARAAWASSFIDACIQGTLGLVSITDHHDVNFIPYVTEAAKAQGIVAVFPGVEVTCSDKTQCLAIFDPASDPSVWTRLINQLPEIEMAPATSAKISPTEVANISIEALFDRVANDTVLRDQCILLPHFSDGSAHKHLNIDGHQLRFCNIKCDGVYIEKPYDELLPETKQKAYGNIPDWGARRRAFIATGDNRKANWERLGFHSCWIKLGETSIEGLRQALLADESRITYTPPVTPIDKIVEVRVLSTLTGPSELSLSFNEGFNALIGGRGSGKSALLEYLRFGLGRTETDLPPMNDGETVHDREARLINDTLASGYVDVVLDRGGIREKWHRDLTDRDVIEIEDATGAVTELTLADAQRRFRARAFYQKGLSTTMNRAAAAAEQITGIAAAEQLDARREIDSSIDAAKRQIGAAMRDLASFWQVQLERRRVAAGISDLKARINAITERMKKEGVQQATLDVLAQKPVIDRGKSFQAEVRKTMDADAERLIELKTTLLHVPIYQFEGVSVFPELKELDEAVSKAKATATTHLEAALAEIEALDRKYQKSAASFATLSEDFAQKHAAAMQAQTSSREQVADSKRLSAELATLEQSDIDLAKTESKLVGAPANFNQARSHLEQLVRRRQAVLHLAARKVEKQSRMLKAKMLKDPSPKEYIDAAMGLLEASRVQDAREKCVDWIGELLTPGSEITWPMARDSIVELYKSKIAAGSPSAPSEEIIARIQDIIAFTSGLTPHQATRIFQNLSDETVSNIVAAVPRDSITLTYVENRKASAFDKASPGQQASALLELLLNQSAGTLIVDQPEDDLDNRVIMDIVKLIRSSKSQRQLVFSTHNPNVVVNGDADKVIALRSTTPIGSDDASTQIDIEVDGAIETPEVRRVITHIMEGGKDAFDLRGRKYNFEALEAQLMP